MRIILAIIVLCLSSAAFADIADLQRKLNEAVDKQDYETAAKLRDQISAAKIVEEERLRGSVIPNYAYEHPEDTPHHPNKDVGGAKVVEHDSNAFKPDSQWGRSLTNPYGTYNKKHVKHQKVIGAGQWFHIGGGREFYGNGPLQRSPTPFGERNPVYNQFTVFGNLNTAIAYNDNGAEEQSLIATQLNLFMNYEITATERIHVAFQPLQRGNDITAYFINGEIENEFNAEFNAEPVAAFFEGNIGNMLSGVDRNLQEPLQDVNFSVGLMPIVLQNGLVIEDKFLGVALGHTNANIPALGITNLDTSIFWGFEDVNTEAVPGTQTAVQIIGFNQWADMWGGFAEWGYFFTADNSNQDGDFSVHTVSAAYRRTIGNFSNSGVRVVANFGQNPGNGIAQTADGYLIVLENSFITSNPEHVIPYLNVAYGNDRPQVVAKDNGGPLRNIGIGFETDGITGFPQLRDDANNVLAVAGGVELLDIAGMQFIFEGAGVLDLEGDNHQVGPSFRMQVPLNHYSLFQIDVFYAKRFQSGLDDLFGAEFIYVIKF